MSLYKKISLLTGINYQKFLNLKLIDNDDFYLRQVFTWCHLIINNFIIFGIHLNKRFSIYTAVLKIHFNKDFIETNLFL